jgi:hypothetical protein
MKLKTGLVKHMNKIKINLFVPVNDIQFLDLFDSQYNKTDEVEIVFNQNGIDCDYLFVFEKLNEKISCNCSKKNVIFISGEPPTVKTYHADFLKQFNSVFTCQKDLAHDSKIISFQLLPWLVNKSYKELKAIKSYEKTKLISIVTSNKIFTEGHKKRFDFAMKLKDYFGDKIDLFGRGINDFDDKWDVIAPYKYHIAIENCSYPNYWTEKLTDTYLAGAYPLYYGCPNISDYFSEKAFTQIDINDFEKSVKIIEEIIANETYEKSTEELATAKEQILEKYGFFAYLAEFCKNNYDTSLKKEKITLRTEKFFTQGPYRFWRDFKKKPFYVIGNLFKGKIGL